MTAYLVTSLSVEGPFPEYQSTIHVALVSLERCLHIASETDNSTKVRKINN